MTPEDTQETLTAIRRTIYSEEGGSAEMMAFERLEELADAKVPEAMHQLGQTTGSRCYE